MKEGGGNDRLLYQKDVVYLKDTELDSDLRSPIINLFDSSRMLGIQVLQ